MRSTSLPLRAVVGVLAALLAIVSLGGPVHAADPEGTPWVGDDGYVPGSPEGAPIPSTRGEITLPNTGPLPIAVQEATACRSGPQVGLVRLRDFLLRTFPGAGSLGIYNCRTIAGSSVVSLHGEGRAFDVQSTGDAMRLAIGRCVLLNAVPLRLQRIIDEDTAMPKIWSANTGVWRAYGGGRVPQLLHLERNWAGALDDRDPAAIPGFDLGHCTPPPGPSTPGDTDAPGLTVHADGDLTLAALKVDGSLWTRTFDTQTGWRDFVRHDAGTPWSTRARPAVAAASDGRLWVYAVDATGVLRARYGRNGAWSAWIGFQGGWSTDAGVTTAIGPNGSVTFAAVKANGTAYTKTWTGTTWLPATVHPGTWTATTPPTLLRALDGSLWLLGHHADGSLQTQRQAGGAWGALQSHGAGWATGAAVGATVRSGAAISYVATRADGSLRTRTWNGSAWAASSPRGTSTSWSRTAGPSIARSSDGKLWITAVQTDGTLLSQSYPSSSGQWSPYVVNGSSRGWSPAVGAPLVARPGNRLTLVSVTSIGGLTTNSATNGAWTVLTAHGTLGTWAR